MAKVKYYYDTTTCRFERVEYTFKHIFLRAVSFVFSSLVLSIFLVILFFRFVESPNEKLLRLENEKISSRLSLQHEQIKSLENSLAYLEKQDDNLYRVILNTSPIPKNVRNAGKGGSNRYENLSGYKTSDLLIASASKLEDLLHKASLQTKSYQELFLLAEKRKKEFAHVPAILPVNGTMISGYGVRLHPILKIPRMHSGVDFTCAYGTPVYATADGKVTQAGYESGGYGIQIDIDHSFAYKTKFAHLSRVIVRKDQSVKRGDLIGYTGSSGHSKGPHLHYEIMKDGEKINPINYFFSDLTPKQFRNLKAEAELYTESMD